MLAMKEMNKQINVNEELQLQQNKPSSFFKRQILIFSKVKSRSAHMKTHRSQEMAPQNQQQQLQQTQQNQQFKQIQLQPQTEILRLLQATTTFNLKPKANDDQTSQRIMEHI